MSFDLVLIEFFSSDTFVFLSVFGKTTEKTPRSEIDKAIKRIIDYTNRKVNANEDMGRLQERGQKDKSSSSK